jgi:sugar lactone lactonase YvrE
MKIELDQVRTIGVGIARPEGVMALDDGAILTADSRGCCARITRDGVTSLYGDVEGLPNGICVDAQGNCIIANIGNGQVQSLAPDGTHQVLLTEADGRPVTSPNFPYIDFQDRLWVSNSTARFNVNAALTSPSPDGSVVLVENGIGRIVADGLSFANGLTLDQDEEYLYVAETMERLITRFKVSSDGSLSNR